MRDFFDVVTGFILAQLLVVILTLENRLHGISRFSIHRKIAALILTKKELVFFLEEPPLKFSKDWMWHDCTGVGGQAYLHMTPIRFVGVPLLGRIGFGYYPKRQEQKQNVRF